MRLIVSNALGEPVAELVGKLHALPGRYEAVFHRAHMAPGAYFHRLEAGEQALAGKMVRIK